MDEVKIYTTETCGYCKQAKAYLTRKGVRFTEYDVMKDPAALDEMVKLSGARSVPVIVVCEQVMIGFNSTRLDQMLECAQTRTDLA